ncbi:TRI27 protein, partial [Penelope pileata]|nr:TRI27 protein [Penelope pileata]
EQIRGALEKLRKQKEDFLESKTNRERQRHDFLTRMEAERQKIVSEFRRFRHFLKEWELLLLARLGEVDRELLRREEEEEAKEEGEMSLLNVLIWEMEEKLQRPTGRFLQDPGSALGRWEMGRTQRTMENFSDLERTLRAVSQQNKILQETLGGIRAFITLDPTTAAPWLLLTRDRRGVRWAPMGQELPHNPHRFNISCCVLGSQGFTSGRRFWDVEVTLGGTWALGVARGSVPRRGWLTFRPTDGIWALGRCRNRFRAFTSPPSPVPMGEDPERIRVVLDYGRGEVAFHLPAQKKPLFAFQNAAFGGESVFPFFWV